MRFLERAILRLATWLEVTWLRFYYVDCKWRDEWIAQARSRTANTGTKGMA